MYGSPDTKVKSLDGYNSDPTALSDQSLKNEPQQPPSEGQGNWFVRAWRKAARFLGFNKTYNLPLYIIFAGAMLGFALARTYYLNITGEYAKNALPGEWYNLRSGHYRVGITMHLATCVPAGILVIFQFIPQIRYKAILVHRINGYIVSILLLLTIASAFMIMRKAAGGAPTTQASFGLLGVMTTIALFMGYYNIKRLQVEQHRAWMLRTWFYAGSIITQRIIMIIASNIISLNGNYTSSYTCGEIAFIGGTRALQRKYPECLTTNSSMPLGPDRSIEVPANFNGNGGEQVGASLRSSFALAMYLALAMHAIGVEIYLHLTPAESERLRVVSYRKQLEAGMAHPGSAGLTVDRWGDAPKWMPPAEIAAEQH